MEFALSKILKLSEVLERTGLKKTTLYSEIRRQAFPRPIQLSIRRVGWLDADLEAWLQAKRAA